MKKFNVLLVFGLFLFIELGVSSCSKDNDNILEEEPIDEGDPVGTVYFETSFDAMVWGGDYLADERGLRPIFIEDPDQNNLRVIDESVDPEDRTPGTDGSMDFFEFMAPSYITSHEFEGWTGKNVYERPGYIKVGTNGSRDAFVATPAFSEISEERVNLKVAFKIARWAGASDLVYVEIIGPGTASVPSVQVSSSTSWEDREITVDNATSDTRIRFVSNPVMTGRFFLDDIVVSKAE